MNDSEIKNLMEKYGFRGWSPDVFYDMKNLLEEYKEKIQKDFEKTIDKWENRTDNYTKDGVKIYSIEELREKLKGAKGK